MTKYTSEYLTYFVLNLDQCISGMVRIYLMYQYAKRKKSDIINARTVLYCVIDSIKQDCIFKKKEICGKITKIHTLKLF